MELQNERRRVNEEIRASTDDSIEAVTRRAEVHQARVDELMSRQPFGKTPKGRALFDATLRLSKSGVFHAEAEEVAYLKRKHDASLIDSILRHEALIKRRLDGAP